MTLLGRAGPSTEIELQVLRHEVAVVCTTNPAALRGLRRALAEHGGTDRAVGHSRCAAAARPRGAAAAALPPRPCAAGLPPPHRPTRRRRPGTRAQRRGGAEDGGLNN